MENKSREPAPAARLISENIWESLISPGDLVFDIGANMGDKAEALTKCGARVVCIEPQPACAEALRKRFAQNSSVKVVEKGLAEQPGSLELAICTEKNYISTFSQEWKQGRFKENIWDKTVSVDVITLDHAIKEYGQPRFCKIDVEGFELPVLRGLSRQVDFLSFELAIEFLEQTRACLVHLNQLGYRHFNFSFGETQQFAFSDWVSSFALLSFLQKQEDKLFWGDIYARSPSAQFRKTTAPPNVSPEPPVPQNISGELWPANRIPTDNDDLLWEIENREITKSIRCLYQVGAHRFEEHDVLLKLFSNLEKIILFEPNPELFKTLQTRFSGNSLVQVLPYALSNSDGTAKFFIANNDGHSSSLLDLGKHREIFPNVAYENTINVETVTLPSVMARHQLPPPDMLFVDAQGSEYKILSALTPELKQLIKIIYVEASLEEVYKNAHTLDELRVLLLPELLFAGYAPQNSGTPTHGNAFFINQHAYPLLNFSTPSQNGVEINSAILPISVLIPCRNSMAYLPEHLNNVLQWSDLVQEIVVVDSQSNDGTLEYIKKHLQHPRLRIFDHPPGLYESWNYGISQLNGKYTYIATVGDKITREGIQHLAEAASKLNCDVLISPPEFDAGSGAGVYPESKLGWPIHQMIQEMNIDTPRVLDRGEVLFNAIHHGICSIMGSAASNLYRTEIMKNFPFPTGFGDAGDTAWGVAYGYQVSFGVTPYKCARFLLHAPRPEKPYASDYPLKLFSLAEKHLLQSIKDTPQSWTSEMVQRSYQALAKTGKTLLMLQSEASTNNLKRAEAAEAAAEQNLKRAETAEAVAESSFQDYQRLHSIKKHWWVRLARHTGILKWERFTGKHAPKVSKNELPSAAAPVPFKMETTLEHLVKKGFAPKVIIDIGAAKGYWSELATHFFPSSNFYLLEPLGPNQPRLKELSLKKPQIKFLHCAAGEKEGEQVINVTPDLDGSSLLPFSRARQPQDELVKIVTIDSLLEKGAIEPPQFIKMDVQGYELKVLEGGKKLFDTAEVFIMEVSFYEFMPGNPLFHEVVNYMSNRDFIVYDIAGFLRRPYDDDLGQVDLVFVKKGSSLVASNRWL